MGVFRVFLAISVVLHHFGLQDGQKFVFMDGGVAVILFFIISGFYMSLVINEKYTHQPSPWLSFYLSRILRIYPIYLVVAFLAYIICLSVTRANPLSPHLNLSPLGLMIVLLTNVFIIGQDVLFAMVEDLRNGSPISSAVGYVRDAFGLTGLTFDDRYFFIPQAWSIGIELEFYCIAPFLVRHPSRILLFMALSIAIRSAFYFFGLPSVPYAIRLFPSNLVFFLLGSCSYQLYRIIKSRPAAKSFGWTMMGIVVAAYLVAAFRSNGIHLLPGGEFDDVAHWLLYLALTAALPFVFLCTKNLRADASIGELSYPIYLVHLLILEQVVKPIANIGVSPISLLLFWTVVFSWFLVKTVEQPMDRIRARLSGTGVTLRESWPVLQVGILPRLSQWRKIPS